MGEQAMTEPEFYTIQEFADKLRIHHNTVRKMISVGRIQAFRSGNKGKSTYRIPSTEVPRVCELDMSTLIDRIVEEKLAKRIEEIRTALNGLS